METIEAILKEKNDVEDTMAQIRRVSMLSVEKAEAALAQRNAKRHPLTSIDVQEQKPKKAKKGGKKGP